MTEPRPPAALHSAPRSRGSLLLRYPIPKLERVDPALAGVDLHACSRRTQFMIGVRPGLSDALVLKQPTDVEALRRSGRHLLLRGQKRVPCLGLEFGQMDVEERLEEAISLLLGQTLDGDLGCCGGGPLPRNAGRPFRGPDSRSSARRRRPGAGPRCRHRSTGRTRPTPPVTQAACG
ncbi:hypothetical protein J2S46_001318 [Kitasatospora herbaricolor]|nr:hypothetical protein [Kitasatospora herbaricolor]